MEMDTLLEGFSKVQFKYNKDNEKKAFINKFIKLIDK
jgi:succinate dehydrogenase flavin-adding protein (antitoxin of CptAB toxin-antitoxin module)